jgi:hypothetical protein
VKLNNRANSSHHQIYITYQADHIRKITEGYISLRSQGMKYASSSLVRTCLESMFKLEAVRLNPVNLFHIAYYEHTQDLKLIKSASERSGNKSEEGAKNNWLESKAVLVEMFPDVPLVETRNTIRDFAKAANCEGEYLLLYSVYSNVVHATWRAAQGKFESTHHFDNTSLSLCVARACVAINGFCGEPEEDFTELFDRIQKLTAYDTGR